MAFTPETVQLRSRTLRNRALEAARVARGHVQRTDTTIDLLLSCVDDLKMYAANPKAARSDDEKAQDDKLFAISVKAERGEDVLDDVLALVADDEAETPAEAAPAEPKTEAPAETPAAAQPKATRKVKDTPQA